MFETERLRLRRWLPEDNEPFARLNQDPRVMEYFPTVLTREESDALIQRINAHFDTHGFGLWASALKETGEFIGFIGLNIPSFEAHFTPCVEIGWRLAYEFWGKGYATEGAKAVLTMGFEEFGLSEIVSFTVPKNIRSRRVMENIGMTYHEKDDFMHPKLPEGHLLRPHVLYRAKP